VGGDPFADGFWIGLGVALGMNVFIASYAFTKRLLRMILK